MKSGDDIVPFKPTHPGLTAMLGSDPRPKLAHMPLLFSFSLLAAGVAAVVLAHGLNRAFRIDENVVILSVIGLAILTTVLEFA